MLINFDYVLLKGIVIFFFIVFQGNRGERRGIQSTILWDMPLRSPHAEE